MKPLLRNETNKFVILSKYNVRIFLTSKYHFVFEFYIASYTLTNYADCIETIPLMK